METQTHYKRAVNCLSALQCLCKRYQKSQTSALSEQYGRNNKNSGGKFPPLFHAKHQSQSSSQDTNSRPPLLLALRMIMV